MPIVTSLLDTDYYKLTMSQSAWLHHFDVPVRFGFTNRTKSVELPKFIDIDELRQELELVRQLRFTPDELWYLNESQFVPQGTFSQWYLEFLSKLQLPPIQVEDIGSTFRIETEGPWPAVTFWEIPVLAIINELYYKALTSDSPVSQPKAWFEGEKRLHAKLDLIRSCPWKPHFSDFGTRRRFSKSWQNNVVHSLKDAELGELFLGTSNVFLAKLLGLRPIGTFAHEMDMVYSGIWHGTDEEIRYSHQRVLLDWWNVYGKPYSVALTDTFGTEFFFRDFTVEQARKWRGLRQDSGDPFEFGEKAIKFYKYLGINPTTKLIVFSDGLDVETILALAERFAGRIQVSFGWGTNLTNDLGIAPLSLIMKVISSNGYPTVKLSDNLAKAMGDRQEVERIKRIFGYTRTFSEAVRY